ncbi:hypothetical protein LIER_31835 [Lithospermum erythrorhizon]|uniref:Uncharacterized protein n=1 Tax=Lithospermum erythrorhizon TaxID=34254 RepID=A0AAV3RW45_LITER
MEPNFCKYHRILGHSVEKCFIFKERVMDLARKGQLPWKKSKSPPTTQPSPSSNPLKSRYLLIFWKARADYSDDEDYEVSHVCVEVDDNSTTAEALRVTTPTSSSLQTFTITFTDENLPQEDGTHNKHSMCQAISNIVPSTLRQCLKYCKDGMEKIVKAHENPFAVEEFHFADAKYYKKKGKSQHEEGLKAPQVLPVPQETISTLREAEEDLVQAFKGLTLPFTQPKKVVTTPLKGKSHVTTKGLWYTPKPPLRLLINRPKNEPETKQELPTYTRPTWAVMWRYPSKREVKDEQYPSLHITTEEEEPLPEDAISAPPGLKEDVKIIVDELKEVNLSTDDEPRPTYISALLTPEEKDESVTLLKEFKDVFAWTYKEMPRLAQRWWSITCQ